LAEKGNILTPEWRLILTTGFCGGFTTFSSFAYENINMLKSADYTYFILYISGSVVLGILAAVAGAVIMKLI
jgi:CrcB protein